MKLLNLRGIRIELLVALIFLGGCQKQAKWINLGATREEVYNILGEPDNTDSSIVAVWGRKKPPERQLWRQFVEEDATVVVFAADGRSLIPSASFSQAGIDPTQTDQDVVKMFEENPWYH